MIRAAEARSQVRTRVEESAARVAALKALARVGMPAPPSSLLALVDRPEHQALAASIKRQAEASAVASSPVSDS